MENWICQKEEFIVQEDSKLWGIFRLAKKMGKHNT